MSLRTNVLALVVAALTMAGCSGNQQAESGASGESVATKPKTDLPLVVFAQANSADPWRQVFDADIKAAAKQRESEFNYEQQDAQDDPAKQISAIETMLVKKPKVLLVSPVTEAVESAITQAKQEGVFVILLDRSVPGTNWDVYVGGDNHAIGKAAGEHMAKLLNGKGTVLMIQGIADAKPTTDRRDGFMEAMKANPGITVILGDDCGYQRERAQTYMENFLQGKKPFDAVYAHNDEMAIGAYLAMKAANAPAKPIIGIDACQKEVVDLIKEGKVSATFSYPQPGPKGIEIASDFLKGKKPSSPNEKILLPTEIVTKETADQYLAKHPNLAK